ncbi:DUF2637 domain-containing protein [Spirillospora sp. NPDC048911]|uniref:DUF2637 domain-containing protein n=1 Tax=Spirillospora sp. NPDC048911 TaxID=3364527 RepID=UPI00371866EB
MNASASTANEKTTTSKSHGTNGGTAFPRNETVTLLGPADGALPRISADGQKDPGQDPSDTERPPRALRSCPRIAIVSAIAIAPLILALAALGGIGSFATVRQAAEPWFGGLAWIVPIGLDAGILALLAWDLLAEYLRLPWPMLRWTAWAFIGGTVAVNAAAAHGDLIGIIVHLAMPVLFIITVEGVRHLIRQWAGLAAGVRIESVPKARWLLAPISTALLWRRMVLWHITGYRHGLAVEYQHLLAVSHLQQKHGRWTWRWNAPLADRLALRHLPAQASGRAASLVPALPAETDSGLLALHTEPVQPFARKPTPFAASPTDEEHHDDHPEHSDKEGPVLPEWITSELLTDARDILEAAHRQGAHINKVEFGRRLRNAGHAIANDRLSALRAAALGEGGAV